MPDGRMVSKSISHNEQLGAVSLEADYLFARCIPHLDREGRMAGHPALVKATACPLRAEITVDMIPDLLRQLSGAGLVQWYEADGKQVLQFPGFKNHNRGTRFDREAASRFPAPPSGSTPEKVRTNSGPTAAKVEVEVEAEVEGEEEEPDTQPSVRPSGESRTRDDAQPDHDDGRADAVEEMKRDATEHARTLSGMTRKKFNADVRGIVGGDSETSWHDHTGQPVPWRDRPRYLRLALDRLTSGESDKLHGALRYVIPRQTDPAKRATSDDLAARRTGPAGDAPVFREVNTGAEITARLEEEDRIAAERRAEEDARIAAWEAAQPDELTVKRLRKEAEETARGNPMAAYLDVERLARENYRILVLDLLHRPDPEANRAAS